MKFDLNIERPAPEFIRAPKPVVGDVYAAKASGPKFYRRGTRYWIIASITPGQFGSEVHHMLGLTEEGEINSTTSYGGHVMRERERIGHCPGIADLNLKINWEIS